jgi:predicted SAM-dependent methyltransferase
MIRQQVKDLYFGLVRYLTLPNALLARLRFSRRIAVKGGLRLHLGCGPHYIPGMINIDGNLFRKKDLWLDLRNPLPFPDQSASLIYCSHMLEHLFPDDAIRLLKEMRRLLADDGVARVAVPCMEHALVIARGEAAMPFPRRFDDPLAQAINYLFCDGQHKFGYSWALLADFAAQAGFTRVSNYSIQCGVSQKKYGPIVLGNEPPGSLVVELGR